MGKILVTGGAGFIGSQTVQHLKQKGFTPIVVDWNWAPWKTPGIPSENIYKYDYAEWPSIVEEMDAVIHFAAFHEVKQSVLHPNSFYENNVSRTRLLLNECRKWQVPIIFSGTSSVYGNPTDPSITSFDESYPVNPMNPYARSKLAVEWMIQDFHQAYGLDYINLRYFNAAGADPNGDLGYCQKPASHIIPILMDKISHDKPFEIFGNDYPTKDGTCVRDYIHVVDLANAHVCAVEYILSKAQVAETINLGTGVGNSVLEVINTTAKVLKKEPNYTISARRIGDPAYLVSNSAKANHMLAWTPKYTIEDIINHAWNWEQTKHLTIME